MSQTKITHTVRAPVQPNTNEVGVRQELKKRWPNKRVASLKPVNGFWEIELEEKLAAPPPPPPVGDDGPPPEDDAGLKDEVDADEAPTNDEDSPDEGGSKKSPASKKPKDPVQHLQQLMGEMQGVIKQLADKAKTVDDIHDTIKPHVNDGPDEGATLPEDIGPTPGKLAPGSPAGRGMGGPLDGRKPPMGVPPTFTNRNSKVVFRRYAASDEIGIPSVIDEIMNDPRYAGWEVESVTNEKRNSRFVAKLRKIEE